jgi:hypothetical protein
MDQMYPETGTNQAKYSQIMLRKTNLFGTLEYPIHDHDYETKQHG